MPKKKHKPFRRRIPGIDMGPAPGLSKQHTVTISPGMSRLIRYIGMETQDEEMMNRQNDDVKFQVPKDRERLLELYNWSAMLNEDRRLMPFNSLFAVADHFSSQLSYA